MNGFAFFRPVVATTMIIAALAMLSCSKPSPEREHLVTIGAQTWMRSNLSVVTFRNGDTIPQARSDEDWNAARFANTAAWCYVKNDSTTEQAFGKLYNWYAVNDPRGLAPEGFHIPSDDEWEELFSGNDGEMFSVERAGTRTFAGPFENEGMGFWWSATGNETYDHQYAWYRVVGTKNDSLHRATYVKGSGFSVRCVKDAD